MMSKRNKVGLLFVLLSLMFLYPGLTFDILTISIEPRLPLVGKLELYSETRSILGTIENLYETSNILIANLILLFSVLIPFFKAIMLLFSLLLKKNDIKKRLFVIVRSIGKWSMVDVFVVGIFVAFLSVGATKGMVAQVGDGFYYFTGYCLLSILSTQLIKLDEKEFA